MTTEEADWKVNACRNHVFQLEYSVKIAPPTKHSTALGYFHGLKRLVVAPNLEAAVALLKRLHSGETVEGIKETDMGNCIVP